MGDDHKKDKKSEPVKLTAEQRDRLARMAADFPGLMEYAHHAGGAPIVPTEEGAIKGKAMQAMEEQTSATMDILSDFLKLAVKHAGALKERVELSQAVYAARINFTPIIGKEYFLYSGATGDRVLSMIGPQEWGRGSPLGDCQARLRLQADHTWAIVEKYTDDEV